MIWLFIKTYWRPLAIALVLLAVAASIGWYGHSKFNAGYAQAKAEAALAATALSEGMQYERDRADAEHRGTILVRDAALRDLDAVRRDLDGVLRAHGRDPKNPSSGRRSDDTGPDWIGGFAACYGEYADLAADAAGWADQVNGLRGYVRAITRNQ